MPPTDSPQTRRRKHVITRSADYASCVAVGDINDDGFLDILAASARDGKIAWCFRPCEYFIDQSRRRRGRDADSPRTGRGRDAE